MFCTAERRICNFHLYRIFPGNNVAFLNHVYLFPCSTNCFFLIPASKEWVKGETFCEQDGDDEIVKVREFTEDEVGPRQHCGKEALNQLSPAERTQIVRVGDVLRAMKSKDAMEIERAVLALKGAAGPLVQGVVAKLIKEPGYIEQTIPLELCRNLYDVRLVMWKPKKGSLRPGLLCPDVRAAYWILALWSAVGAKPGPRLCPKCDKLFVQTRADQEYCSLKCREAHRVKRWRESHKKHSGQRKRGGKR